jgi:hypothetical protein
MARNILGLMPVMIWFWIGRWWWIIGYRRWSIGMDLMSQEAPQCNSPQSDGSTLPSMAGF